jgi:hypothetical protein
MSDTSIKSKQNKMLVCTDCGRLADCSCVLQEREHELEFVEWCEYELRLQEELYYDMLHEALNPNPNPSEDDEDDGDEFYYFSEDEYDVRFKERSIKTVDVITTVFDIDDMRTVWEDNLSARSIPKNILHRNLNTMHFVD